MDKLGLSLIVCMVFSWAAVIGAGIAIIEVVVGNYTEQQLGGVGSIVLLGLFGASYLIWYYREEE